MTFAYIADCYPDPAVRAKCACNSLPPRSPRIKYRLRCKYMALITSVRVSGLQPFRRPAGRWQMVLARPGLCSLVSWMLASASVTLRSVALQNVRILRGGPSDRCVRRTERRHCHVASSPHARTPRQGAVADRAAARRHHHVPATRRLLPRAEEAPHPHVPARRRTPSPLPIHTGSSSSKQQAASSKQPAAAAPPLRIPSTLRLPLCPVAPRPLKTFFVGPVSWAAGRTARWSRFLEGF